MKHKGKRSALRLIFLIPRALLGKACVMQSALDQVRGSHGPSTRTVEELLDEIMGYENPEVVKRLQRELELTEEEAKILFDDTKRFLYLSAVHPGKWSPPKRVDQGWHEFLMFTRDYADFCQRHFGRFVHHEPKRSTEPSTGGSQTRNAILAARELFGDLSSNWDFRGKSLLGQNSMEVNSDMCGGSCGSDGGGCSPND